jgi:hypothetical protein
MPPRKRIARYNNFVAAAAVVAAAKPHCVAVLVAPRALQNNKPIKTLPDTVLERASARYFTAQATTRSRSSSHKVPATCDKFVCAITAAKPHYVAALVTPHVLQNDAPAKALPN